MAGILDMMGYIQDQGEQGRKRGLASLVGKAYAADPAEQQRLLGLVAQRGEPGMAMEAQKGFDDQSADLHKQLAQRAGMVVSLYKANPQMAQQAYAAMLPLAARAGFPQAQAHPQLDDSLIPGLEKLASALQTGTTANVQSTYIDDKGQRVAIMRNGSVQVLGANAPNNQIIDTGNGFFGVNKGNLQAAPVMTGGAPAPQQQRAPGEVPFSIDPSLPPEVQADIRANEAKYAQAPDGADIGIGGGGGMPPGGQLRSAPKPINPMDQARLQLAQQAAQRAQEASQRAAQAQQLQQRGNAPAGYRFKADGSLEAIPGAPQTASAETSKQDVYAKNMAQDALAFAAAFTGLPQARLAQMTPEQVKAEMLKHDRMTTGPVVGSIWGMGKLANADLEAYSNSASGKQARINNPTGPVTNADFEVARKSVFSADKPKQVNADLVFQALSRARQAPQQAKPAQGGGAVPRAVNPQTGQTLELRNGQWVPAQ